MSRAPRDAHPLVPAVSSASSSSEPADHDEILAVRDVDFSYGHLQVLFEMSVSVRRGEALALLGTNGAGKSTLLRVICGLLPPTNGQVVFDGMDITDTPARRLPSQGLVLVSGGRSVFGDMTVSENLDVQGLTARKRVAWLRERREKVFEVFPRLRDRQSQQAGTLSGGEQQQLALAKAILLEPKVLCIDELSLGLAPIVVQNLLEIVKRIHADGVTVVLVEQSLSIAASMCERAVFMEKGAVTFLGSTGDLLERDDIARAVFFGSQ